MVYPRRNEDYFSDGFRNFIVGISPMSRQPRAVFPGDYYEMRISAKETVQEWFKRIIDSQFGSEPKLCSLEENMAVLAQLKYNGKIIQYARVHVVVTDDDLETFYLMKTVSHKYFRLDYDLNRLGKMFRESQPHIHVIPSGEPRFGGPYSPSQNIIVDFFDFLYRNFYYERWLEWAQIAYQEDIRVTHKPDVFEPIVHAFRAGQYDLLVSKYSKHLKYIKNACRSLKDKLFPCRIDTKAAVISYCER